MMWQTCCLIRGHSISPVCQIVYAFWFIYFSLLQFEQSVIVKIKFILKFCQMIQFAKFLYYVITLIIHYIYSTVINSYYQSIIYFVELLRFI